MTTNNHKPTVEASNPSKPHAEEHDRGLRHPPTPRHHPAACSPPRPALTLRDVTGQLRHRYGNDLSDLEIGILAVAWLDNQPLHTDTHHHDRLIVQWATQLVQGGSTDTRTALAAARAVARDRRTNGSRPPGVIRSDELSLDEALRIPEVTAALGLDQLEVVGRRVRPEPAFVLIERHQIGPHTAELWGPPPAPPMRGRAASTPTGELIGICIRCRGAVGDKEWTFGAWDGSDWRFSGYTLRGAKRLAALRPLLCCDCAVRVKHKLIDGPAPERQAEWQDGVSPASVENPDDDPDPKAQARRARNGAVTS
jgi:hypothetical protein